MAWLRSAMHKAVEAHGRSSFGAAVRSHIGYVNRSSNSKKLKDRIAARNMKNYKEAVRSLEKVASSSRGEERVQLLRKWLVSLQETESMKAGSAENDEIRPGKSDAVLYYDPDLGVSPVNFCDVFLHSQALECMTISMILEEPNEEEILLLHKLFGLCLAGGEEVHDVIVKRILDLSKAFSVYGEEVLAKRKELLQCAQGAIAGLKVNADILRIDSEVSEIQKNLKRVDLQEFLIESEGSSLDETLEVIKQSVAPIQLCCRLESLLLKKRLLNTGDAPEAHALTVDKLKVLSESLLSSASKTEKRISDHRQQKEEALHFRVVKTSEVSQIEKDLAAEITMLEKQRDKLEAELKKVNSSLAVANARLQNAREEREQFDDANNELLVHFKSKEDELSKAIVSYRAEADTCNAFVEFLEATWDIQSSFMEKKNKTINDELENHEEYFVNVTRSLLSAYKDALGPAIMNIKDHMKNLERSEKAADPDEEFLKDIEQRKALEQAYLAAETKIITIFDAAESVKKKFYHATDDVSRKGVEPVNELCEAIEKIKADFESLARPTLKNEKSTRGEKMLSKESSQKCVSPSSKRVLAVDLKSIFAQKLVLLSPNKIPYIPLGGSAENSPNLNDDTKLVEAEKEEVQVREDEKSSHPDEEVSNLGLEIKSKNIEHSAVGVGVSSKNSPNLNGDDTKLVEAEQEKVKMKEDEKLSHPDKELSNLALEIENKNIEHSAVDVGGKYDKQKTDQGKLLQPSASVKESSSSVGKALINMDLEKESREHLKVECGGNMDIAEGQKSKMSQPSTSGDTKLLEPSKELASLASPKEIVNPKTAEHEQEKTSQVSTSIDEKLLHLDNEMSMLASEVSGNTKTSNAKQRKMSQSSTSESDKSSDSDEEQVEEEDEEEEDEEEDWHSPQSDHSVKSRNAA